MNKLSNIRIFIATPSHYNSILALTNDAFMADTFFKKTEYHLRFTLEQVREMMNNDQSMFILAKGDNSSITNTVDSSDNSIEVDCGSLYFHWDKEIIDNQFKITGKFSAVSVPILYSGQGIGKILVQETENILKQIAHDEWNKYNENNKQIQTILNVKMEMGVINQRKDLFPWYEKQGYDIINEIRPNEEELLRVCLDELANDICCVLMRKTII